MRLIDADALKGRMLAETPEHEKGVADLFLEAVAVMIDEQPTIEERKTVSDEEWIKARGGWTNQPERKKGKWLETDSHEPCWYKCDQCGRLSDIKEIYCPTCGASMVNTTCGADMRGREDG